MHFKDVSDHVNAPHGKEMMAQVAGRRVGHCMLQVREPFCIWSDNTWSDNFEHDSSHAWTNLGMKISFLCMKMKFLKYFMNENSMHGIVYMFMHKRVNFMYGNFTLSCMKEDFLSCHNVFMHETFRTGVYHTHSFCSGYCKTGNDCVILIIAF